MDFVGIGLLFAHVLAAMGWFFCLGHLLTALLAPQHMKWPVIFTVGVAAIGAFFSLVTPFIPVPPAASVAMGVLLVLIWIWKRPAIPPVEIPKASLEWGTVIFFLALYAYVLLLMRDFGYDAMSYHLPFIQEFATAGQVPIPTVFYNWTDHVHVVYPKAVEIIFGLFQALIPVQQSYRLLQLIGLICSSWGLHALAQKFHVKRPMHVVIIFLSTGLVLDYSKSFYVESFLFLWIIWLLNWSYNESQQPHPLLFGIIGVAIGMAKISALPYLAALMGVAYLFNRKSNLPLAAIIGGAIGAGAQFLSVWASGHSLLEELRISQAVSTGVIIEYGPRIAIMLSGFWQYLVPSAIGIGILLMPILYIKKPLLRPLLLGIAAAIMALFASLLLSDLYYLTYLQFGTYYGFGFIGVAALFFIAFLEELRNSKHKTLSMIATGFMVVVIVAGLLSQVLFIYLAHHGIVQNAHAYEQMRMQIPNAATTKIHFMNNINPITYGFENARVYDFTYFPRLEGDPCAFWKENGFTHVIFWRLVPTSLQLDGGNPLFYEKARESLLANTCTTIIVPPRGESYPLIARVN